MLIYKMNKKRGFTLIELLVVLSIIGVIMAFSFVGFSQARKSARDTKRKADLEQIRSALEIYRTDCKTYPTTITPGSPLVGAAAICAGNTYMSAVPADSTTGQSYYYSGSTNSYTLCAYLETLGVVSLTGCTNNCGSPNNCNYKTIQP